MLTAAATLLSGLLGAAALQYLLDVWRRREGPPGPWGLPLVGHLLSLRPNLWETGMRLRRRYGDIIQLPALPGKELLLIQGYEALYEVLVASGDQFNGRLRGTSALRLLNPHHQGIVSSMGPASDTLRRFSLRTLKNFGLGRAESERLILGEFEQLRAAFLATGGREFDPREHVNRSVSLVTCRFLFGDSAEYDSHRFSEYLEASDTVLRYQLQSSLLNQFFLHLPFLMRIVPESCCSVKKVKRATDMLLQFSRLQVDLHRSQMSEDGCGGGAEPSNYTEAFLAEQLKPDAPADLFNDEQLTRCLVDLFIAGSDTTTNSLLWSLLLMALHRDVQDRVHSELLAAVGTGRLPTMRDRQLTPYTDAVIHEVLRYRPIAPILLPHTTLHGAEARLRGYRVPGNTPILLSVASVHRDPRHWARPEEFYPGHFLNSEGNKFCPSECFVPFGLGRRACMGEALARMELYLFFSCIFLSFRVSLADCQPSPVADILQGNLAGAVLSPLPFRLCVTPR